ncbi:Hypothetical predicted protein [Drosophila guanche]|uniref:Single domain-containing protein n=1 Tax=Drosophila guanche TaxID=7266 RepID=A0A3B0JMU2_DROGU|nr:Hypothetical predicted protein [Drosophila guanche]
MAKAARPQRVTSSRAARCKTIKCAAFTFAAAKTGTASYTSKYPAPTIVSCSFVILFHVFSCQIPATFAECSGTGVGTDIDYPDCCWKCVKEKDCSKGGAAGEAEKEKDTQNPVL